MSVNSTLDLALRDILHGINPLQTDWSMRFQIISELQAVVQSVESLRGATVEPFGSFVSNLFSRWGDLDISIELPNGSYILCAAKKHKQNLLVDVLRALRRRGGWHKLQYVSHARVPILKLVSYQNISCDISINNLNGQMKSKLLYWISLIDGRFRDMVLLVKEWAKAHNINDPKSGTLNSYSLSLLVIFHFQTCVPAILPPLREIYPENLVDNLIGVRVVAERGIEETCAANIARFREDKSRVANRSSLSELFISFLAKFSSITLEQGICTYTGQWEDIDSNMRWMPKTYVLYIEDPFEQPLNTARSVSSGQMTRILEALQTTHRMLTSAASANQNRGSIIAALVRPQILSFVIPRTPFINHNDYNRNRPQVQRNVHTPSQVQQQFQNMRLDSRPNNMTMQSPAQTSSSQGHVHTPSQVQQQFQNMRLDSRLNNMTMQRPAQTSSSQGQQVWRPNRRP